VKFDTTTIRLILAIAEEGSISRAADRLSLAVAAASRRVTDLEDQLGSKLFKRVPHGVEITESGEKLLQYVRQIDNLIDRLQGDAQALNQGLDGRIPRPLSSSSWPARSPTSSANIPASP
jgi:molybdate transport repressor ModE-like protein